MSHGHAEKLERYADSLYGELQAEKHVHRKDNEYLLAENQRLEAGFDASQEQLAKVIGNRAEFRHRAEVAEAENQRLRDALAIAHTLLIEADYHRDPDYRQEWQTISEALAGDGDG